MSTITVSTLTGAAIQAAINTLEAATPPGGTVQLVEGDYICSSTLTIATDSIVLKGTKDEEGLPASILSFETAPAQTALVMSKSVLGDSQTGVEVIDIEFKGPGTFDQAAIAIKSSFALGCVLRNVHITDFYTGLYSDTAGYLQVEDSTFFSCTVGVYGPPFVDPSYLQNRVLLNNCEFLFSHQHAIWLENPSHARVNSCTFEESEGSIVVKCGNHATNTEEIADFHIEACTWASTNEGQAFVLKRGAASSAYGISLTGSTLSGVATSEVPLIEVVDSSQVTISGNQINACGSTAIKLQLLSAGYVDGNTCNGWNASGADGSCLHFVDCSSMTMIGNNVNWPALHPTYAFSIALVGDSTGNMIIGNVFTDYYTIAQGNVLINNTFLEL